MSKFRKEKDKNMEQRRLKLEYRPYREGEDDLLSPNPDPNQTNGELNIANLSKKLKHLISQTFDPTHLNNPKFDPNHYNDFYLIAAVLKYLIERSNNPQDKDSDSDKSQSHLQALGKNIRDLKQCIADYFVCFQPDAFSDVYVSIVVNTALFSDASLLKYLCSFADFYHVRNTLLYFFLLSIKETTQFTADDNQRYSFLNNSLRIEEYCLQLIKDTNATHLKIRLSHFTKTLLLLFIVHSNPSIAPQLSFHTQEILLYITNHLNFHDYLRFFRLLGNYFDVNEGNKKLIKDRLLNNDYKPSIYVVNEVFGRFVSGVELKNIILSVISIDSKFKLVDDADAEELATERFGELLIGVFSLSGSTGGIKNLESIALLDIYKNVRIPDNLYFHILEFLQLHNFDLDDRLTIKQYNQPRFINSLVYLYARESKLLVLKTLFKSLCLLDALDPQFTLTVLAPFQSEFHTHILSNRRIISQLLDYRLPLLEAVGTLFNDQSQIDLLFGAIKERDSWNIKMVEIALNTPASRESLLDLIGFLVPRAAGIFSKSMDYLLKVEFIDNIAIFLESLYASSLEKIIKLDPIGTHGYRLFDKIYSHNPAAVVNIINKISCKTLSNFFRSRYSFSYINRFFPGSFDAIFNRMGCHQSPKLSVLIMRGLLTPLIMDKDLETKWKVDLATVSKDFFNALSYIFTKYPNPSIKIKSRMRQVGAEFSLFKSTPLHLLDSEVKFVPQPCMDRIVSYETSAPMVIAPISVRKAVLRIRPRTPLSIPHMFFNTAKTSLKLDSLKFIGCDSGIYSDSNVNNLSLLLAFKDASPKTDISVTIYNTNFSSASKDLLSLITKLKYIYQYFYRGTISKGLLCNVRKFVLPQLVDSNNNIHALINDAVSLIQKAGKLESIKFNNTLSPDVVCKFININPHLSKLIFKYRLDAITPLIESELNLILKTLDQPPYHQITTIKFTILYHDKSKTKQHIPMINQDQVASKVINLNNFKPIDSKLFIFRRQTS